MASQDNKDIMQPILSEKTREIIAEAFEQGKTYRESDRLKEDGDFREAMKRQYEEQHVKELGILHEALQENFHLASKSWGKSIILVAADIVREYGKLHPTFDEVKAEDHLKKEALRLKDNNKMAIYELERLQKSLGFRRNGYVDTQFKQIIDILKDDE